MDKHFGPDGFVPMVNLDDHLPKDPDKSIADVLIAFRWNNVRWHSLTALPYMAAMSGIEYEKAVRRTLWNNFGKPFLADSNRPSFPRLLEEEIANNRGFNGDTSTKMLTPDWNLVFHPSFTTSQVDEFVNRSVIAIYHSQVVSAWTMFESLASDLWTAAVNSQPDPLAGLTGSEKRIHNKSKGTPDPTPDEPEANEEIADDEFIMINSAKSIGIKHLHNLTRGDFNLSSMMGDLMVAAGRAKFSSLPEIRDTYSLAFSEKHAIKPSDIDAALSGDDLESLAIVRNAIVHRAGKADAEYVRRQKHCNSAPHTGKGKDIVLDKLTTRKLIDPVVMSSLNLIKGVDQWLKKNKARKAKKKNKPNQ